MCKLEIVIGKMCASFDYQLPVHAEMSYDGRIALKSCRKSPVVRPSTGIQLTCQETSVDIRVSVVLVKQSANGGRLSGPNIVLSCL